MQVADLIRAIFVIAILVSAPSAKSLPVAQKKVSLTPSIQKAKARIGDLQRRIETALKKANAASVQCFPAEQSEPTNTNGLGSVSGTVITTDGLIATCAHHDLVPGTALSIRFPEGKTVDGKVLGWHRVWDVGLLKITSPGPWPHVEMGRSTDLSRGDPCLVLGYPYDDCFGDRREDVRPRVRLARITQFDPGRIETACEASAGDSGGGLFDLNGCIVGITVSVRGMGRAGHVGIEFIRDYWNPLVAGELLHMQPNDKPTVTQDLAAAKLQTVKPTIITYFAKSNAGVRFQNSGVILTVDGLIATVPEYDLPWGSIISVQLHDGRRADARVLGEHHACGVTMLKMTSRGSWPHVELRQVSSLKLGDSCFSLNYQLADRPSRERGSAKLAVQYGKIVRVDAYPGVVESTCSLELEDAGGGLFDSSGRLIGIHQEGSFRREGWLATHISSDWLQKFWEELEAPIPWSGMIPLSTAKIDSAFFVAVRDAKQSVVQILCDQRDVALGAIVDSDGWVVTKASELMGRNIVCRLHDGRELQAALHAASRQHDLALLRLGEVAGLPEIRWSEKVNHPVGTLIMAIGSQDAPEQIGIVGSPPHRVKHFQGLLPIGNVRDAPGGVEVFQYDWQLKLRLPKPAIHIGDVITATDGEEVANLASWSQMIGPKIAEMEPGDSIRIRVKRGSEKQNLRVRFLPESDLGVRLSPSPRHTGFPRVFDACIPLETNQVGGPVVNASGEVVGIAIARAWNRTSYILPVGRVRQLIDDLKKSAK